MAGIDKKVSIDSKLMHKMEKRPTSAIKVYNSTSARMMRAEEATADSTNGITMLSMTGNSSHIRTIEVGGSQKFRLKASTNFYKDQI